MATYYVWNGGDNTTGTSWATAKTTFAAGLALATVTGDSVLVAHTHSGDQALGSTTLTVPATNLYCEVYSVDKDNADTPTPMSANYIGGSGVSSAYIALKCTGVSYWYGLRLRCGGSNGNGVYTSVTDGHHELESCTLENAGSGANVGHVLGSATSGLESYARLVNCALSVANVNSDIQINGMVEMYGCTLSGAALTTLFTASATIATGAGLYAEGCDFSSAASGSTLFNTGGTALGLGITLVNCKLPASFLMTSGGTKKAHGEINLFNCANGDTHYFIGHADAMGKTEAIATIYPTTNNTGDIAWKITTTAYAKKGAPYVTPWFDMAHDATVSIAPEIEILRDGSATAYTDEQVWGDFSFPGSGTNPKSVIKSTRAGPLAAASSLPDGIGSGAWTNPPGTSKSSKIVAPATAPTDIGHLRARVCVGLASQTLYADPTIRGI